MHILTLNSGATVVVPTEFETQEDADRKMSNYVYPIIEDEMSREFCEIVKSGVEALTKGGWSAEDEIEGCYLDLEYKDSQLCEINNLCYELLKLKAVINSKKATELIEKIFTISEDY